LRNNKTFALLNIVNTPIDEEEKELIQSLCKHLSISTKSHSLQEELHKKNRDFIMLREVSKALSPIMDEEELLKKILDKSTELVRAKHGSLMLLDSERKVLVVKAIKGINEKLVEHLRIKVGDGISGRVLETSTPMLVQDIERDKRFNKKSRPRYETASFLSIPLSVRLRPIGVLNISDKINGEVFSEEDLDLLLSFIFYATVALERSKFYHMSEELRKISITDPLTNLLNRRYFIDRLSGEVERSKRDGKPFTFMMIDIDNFKKFNDSRGHLAGDEALRRVSRAIIHTVRTIDVASRYGGEEFSVILPLTNKESSLIIAERLRQEVEKIYFEKTKELPEVNLSVSIGLASYPLDARDATELINHADKALYFAKESGKNRVVLFEKEKFLL
jgi:diguanylate cyclase (GGDEF)-like protein